MLNELGQCCGRKPLIYKGVHSARQRFCCRCDKAYDLDTGEPIENWAYRVVDGAHVRKQSEGRDTVHLSQQDQRVIDRAFRRSVLIIDDGEGRADG